MMTASQSASSSSSSPVPSQQPQTQKGRNVSGRTWKASETKRSSAVKATAPSDWSKRAAEREERKKMKETEAELLEGRKERLAAAKKKREDKKARAQQNEFKSSTFQVISNDKTVKSLSKKQMRAIKRTRVSAQGQVELVGAYAPTYGDVQSRPAATKRRRAR